MAVLRAAKPRPVSFKQAFDALNATDAALRQSLRRPRLRSTTRAEIERILEEMTSPILTYSGSGWGPPTFKQVIDALDATDAALRQLLTRPRLRSAVRGDTERIIEELTAPVLIRDGKRAQRLTPL